MYTRVGELEDALELQACHPRNPIMHKTQSFVVRVLNRSKKGRRTHGVVEIVDTGRRRPFTNSEELWAIVNGSKKPRKQQPD